MICYICYNPEIMSAWLLGIIGEPLLIIYQLRAMVKCAKTTKMADESAHNLQVLLVTETDPSLSRMDHSRLISWRVRSPPCNHQCRHDVITVGSCSCPILVVAAVKGTPSPKIYVCVWDFAHLRMPSGNIHSRKQGLLYQGFSLWFMACSR